MSFLSEKQRQTELWRVPSIRGLWGPDSKDPAVRLMETALKVLAERGWTKFRFKNERGNVCLLGALRVADGRSARWPGCRSPAYRQAVARLNRLARDRGYSRATFFNDDLSIGYKDVVAFTKEAMSRGGPRPRVELETRAFLPRSREVSRH
jgi:hypothetical protein